MFARYVTCIAVGIVLAGVAQATKFELKASPTTTHISFFDASLPPVLTIDSGDHVKLETASGNPRYFEKIVVPKEKIPAELGLCPGGGTMPEEFPYQRDRPVWIDVI